MQLVPPDSPISLAEDTTTSATKIKFTWSDGASNGGS